MDTAWIVAIGGIVTTVLGFVLNWLRLRAKAAEQERTSRMQASADAAARDADEVKRLRTERSQEIARLREDLLRLQRQYDRETRALRQEVNTLKEQRTADQVTIATQVGRITELTETVEGLKGELAECLGTHERRAL